MRPSKVYRVVAAASAGLWDRLPATARPRRRPLVLSSLALVPLVLLILDMWTTGIPDVLHLVWVAAAMGVLLIRSLGLTTEVETEHLLRRDVERLLAEREYAATHDALTGLANREAFRTALDRAVHSPRPAGRVAAVMIADLDSFKAINDRHGHAAGDAVLLEMGQRLTVQARSGDAVARLGADEFAVVVANVSVGDALGLADRFAALLNQPVSWAGQELTVSASVGLYLADTRFDPDEAVVKADAAQHSAKSLGGGRAELFDEARHGRLIERHQVESELRQAVTEGDLVLHYQPILDLVTRRIVGAEALLRWLHPRHGLLAPAAFLDVAEASGAILGMGDWALTQACADAAAWQREVAGGSDVGVAVNLSRRQLQSPSLIDDTVRALLDSGLAPPQLTIEVTEAALMSDTEMMVGVLDELSALGAVVALDDFGTGYSSLARLRELPIDVLKIDESVVHGIARNDEEWTLASAIVRLATGLGKVTVAEGIEAGAQLAHLRSLGCQRGQGNLLARPMPFAAFVAFLTQHNTVSS